MRLKRKPNPSRSIPSRSAPSFSPKMPMVPPRTSLRGTMGSKRPPDLTPSRFKPNMPMIPNLSKRPPVPTRTGGAASKVGASTKPMIKAMPRMRTGMKTGGKVKK